MKFSNGCWLQKEGCACFAPAEISFTEKDADRIRIYTPTHAIMQKGDTLGGAMLTIEVSTPAEGIISLKASHYLGVKDDGPRFELNTDPEAMADIREKRKNITVKSGEAELRVDGSAMEFTFFYQGRKKCSFSGKDLAYMKTDYRGDCYVSSEDTDAYMRQRLSIGVGEQIYGLGEHFTPFVKNGQSIDIWNEDGGTSTDQSYKNIPFYISSRSYGILVNHTGKVSYEIGTDAVDKVQFSVPGESLEYFFIGGSDMKDVLRHYTQLTGRAPLPAPWTFGLWLSTSFTTKYDEKTVMSFIDGMEQRKIPLSVFHFDSFWMKGFHWCDFTWDAGIFPDPAGMLERIHQKGLRICVWINPYIAQASSLFQEGMEKGYFLKRKDGSVWQWDMWQPGMAIVDFTNPDAAAWYQEKLAGLLDLGVDCFKTDFGERIPTDCVYFSGADPVRMHNYYTYLYNKCVYELLARRKGAKDAVLFARSASVGGQKFPVHWGGDCWSTYTAMEQSLRGGLSLLMSGFSFWSHDIGGFEKTSTPDVYKRWCAFGLLSSHSRLHGSTSYRVPWAYDEEAVDVLRFFTRLKASLMPYLYAAAEEAHADGVPMMRSMVMEFPDDPTCAYLDRQYMLGSSLLTAPVMNEEGIAEYYLPEGIWTNYFTGEEREGGKWFREKLGYCELPLWVKQDSVISEGAHDDGPEYDYAENVTLKIYRPADGTKKSIIITGPDGSEEERFEIERKASLISIDAKGGHPYQVKLMNSRNAGIAGDSKASKVSKVSDAVKAVSQKDGTLFTGCRGKIKLTVGAGKNEQRIQ